MTAVTDRIQVEAPPDACYEYWRDFSQLAFLLDEVKDVRETGPDTYHWEIDGPIGTTADWIAHVTEDPKRRRISWESVGGNVQSSGTVRFEPRGARTLITVSLAYSLPAGKLGEIVARLSSKDPDKLLRRALEAFKAFAEQLWRSHRASAGAR